MPLLTMEIAGDRPPRYGEIETRRSLLPEGIGPTAVVCDRLIANNCIETGRSLLPGAIETGRSLLLGKWNRHP